MAVVVGMVMRMPVAAVVVVAAKVRLRGATVAGAVKAVVAATTVITGTVIRTPTVVVVAAVARRRPKRQKCQHSEGLSKLPCVARIARQ